MGGPNMTEDIFEGIEKTGNLSVTLEKLRIEDLLSDEFLEFLSENFPKRKVRPSNLTFVLLPREEDTGGEENMDIEDIEEGDLSLTIGTPDSIEFEHRGEKEYQEKRLVVIADREKDLDVILENLEVKK